MLAAAGFMLAPPISAAPKNKAKEQEAKKKLIADCDTCLSFFSAKSLKFTANGAKCAKLLAECDKTNRSSKCEPVINACIDANCNSAGACSSATGNRELFYGCLKAEHKFLPYQCASTIAGMASSMASTIREEQAEAERAHEAELAKADADAAAAEARSKEAQAKAAAEVEREKSASAERMKQAELKAAADLENQRAANERKAVADAKAAEKQAVLDIKNAKPNVALSNTFADAKKGLADARAATTKLFTLLGIKPTDGTEGTSNIMNFAPPQVDTPEIEGELQCEFLNDGRTCKWCWGGMDTSEEKNEGGKTSGQKCATNATKSGAVKLASRYYDKNGGSYKDWKCTKDVKENAVRAELENAYRALSSTSARLGESIAKIESNNADDESQETLDSGKIEKLFEAQGYIDDVLSKMQEYVGPLTTTCSTLCAGMTTMPTFGSSTKSSKMKFDENGDIVREEAAPVKTEGWICKEFDKHTDKPAIAALLAGKSSSASMLGGVGNQANELTLRVLTAVVQTDFALNEAEIKVAFVQDSMENQGSGGGFGQKPKIEDVCKNDPVAGDTSGISSCLSQVQNLLSFANTNNNDLQHASRKLGILTGLLAGKPCGQGYTGYCCNSQVPNWNDKPSMQQCIGNLYSKIGGNGGRGGASGEISIERIMTQSASQNSCIMNVEYKMTGRLQPVKALSDFSGMLKNAMFNVENVEYICRANGSGNNGFNCSEDKESCLRINCKNGYGVRYVSTFNNDNYTCSKQEE
jgi:hypothetical protein